MAQPPWMTLLECWKISGSWMGRQQLIRKQASPFSATRAWLSPLRNKMCTVFQLSSKTTSQNELDCGWRHSLQQWSPTVVVVINDLGCYIVRLVNRHGLDVGVRLQGRDMVLGYPATHERPRNSEKRSKNSYYSYIIPRGVPLESHDAPSCRSSKKTCLTSLWPAASPLQHQPLSSSDFATSLCYVREFRDLRHVRETYG